VKLLCSYRNSIAKALFLVKWFVRVVILSGSVAHAADGNEAVPQGYLNCQMGSESWWE
jgi:hypothetical protein